MYEGYATVPGSERWQNYLTLMRKLRAYSNEGQALAIFLPIFKEYPNNPGAAHYIIHASDTAELVSEALPAAQKYAAIAPDSPHALHMPSHIFNRLGLWQDSI